MSVISLVNYAGNSKLPDDIMRSLVTRSTDNASLSELARAYGYTEGPAVGVAVNVSPDTGEIRGGTLALYGEDNPVVFKANMGVRKIWAEAISAVQLNRFPWTAAGSQRRDRILGSIHCLGAGCSVCF